MHQEKGFNFVFMRNNFVGISCHCRISYYVLVLYEACLYKAVNIYFFPLIEEPSWLVSLCIILIMNLLKSYFTQPQKILSALLRWLDTPQSILLRVSGKRLYKIHLHYTTFIYIKQHSSTRIFEATATYLSPFDETTDSWIWFLANSSWPLIPIVKSAPTLAITGGVFSVGSMFDQCLTSFCCTVCNIALC